MQAAPASVQVGERVEVMTSRAFSARRVAQPPVDRIAHARSRDV